MSLKLFSKSTPNLAKSIQGLAKTIKEKALVFLDSLVHFEPFQTIAVTPG
jgi:hypothetical protein